MSSGKTAVANRNAPPQSGKAIVNAQNQSTAELVRLQQINSTNKDDIDKQRKIMQVITITNRSEDAVAMAMHDCDFDENKAINLLLDPDKFGEWETSGKKKKKGQTTSNETNQFANRDQDDNRSKPGRANRRYDRRRTGKTDNNAEQNDNNEKLQNKSNDTRSAGRGRGRGGRGAVQSQSRRNDNKFTQARQNKKPPNSSSSKDQQLTSSQSERQQVKASDTDIGNRPETFSENQTTSQTSANDRRSRNVTAKTQTTTWSKTENLANKLKSSSRAKEMQQQRKEETSAPVSDGFQNISKKTNLQDDLWNTNSSSNDNDRYRVPPGMESQWPAENSSSWDFKKRSDNKTDGPSVLSDLPDLSHDKSLDLVALAKVSKQPQKELPSVKSDDLSTIPNTSSASQPLAAISSPSKKQFLEGNGSEKGIQTNTHGSYDHPKQQRHPKTIKSKRSLKVEPPSKPVEMPHNVVESLNLQFGNLEFGFGSASPEMDSTAKLLQSGTQNEAVSPNTTPTVAPGPVERPTNRNKSSASSPTTAPIGSVDQSGRQYPVSSVEKSQKETVPQVNSEQNLQTPEPTSSAVAGEVSKPSSAATISATSSSLAASTQSTVAPVISTANINAGTSSFNNVVNPTSVSNPNYKNTTTPASGTKNAPTTVPYYFSAAPGMVPATYPANFAYGYDDMSMMSQRIGPFPHLYYDLQFQQYGMRPDAMGNTAGNYSTGNESGNKYGRVDTSSPVSSSISQAQQQGGPHHAASAGQQPPYLNPAMTQGFFPNVYYPGVVPGSFHTYAPVYGMPSKNHGGNMYLNNNTYSGQQGYDDGNAHNDFQAKNGFAGSNPQAQNKSNSNSGTDIANQNYKVQQAQYDKFSNTQAQLNMPLAHGAHATAVPAGYVQQFMLPHVSQQPHPIEASQQQNQQHNQSNKQSAKPGSNNYQYWNTGANQA